MITDLFVPEGRPDQACHGDLGTAIAAMAEQPDLLMTWPGKVVIIAGAHHTLIRTLRSALPSLGDLQLGRALRSAGADWATWAAQDLASGRIEAELRTIAGGRLAGGPTKRAAS